MKQKKVLLGTTDDFQCADSVARHRDGDSLTNDGRVFPAQVTLKGVVAKSSEASDRKKYSQHFYVLIILIIVYML